MKNIAVFTFLIDRRPLTESEIRHGQELWERIKPKEQPNEVEPFSKDQAVLEAARRTVGR